jgi:hypothetical protein
MSKFVSSLRQSKVYLFDAGTHVSLDFVRCNHRIYMIFDLNGKGSLAIARNGFTECFLWLWSETVALCIEYVRDSWPSTSRRSLWKSLWRSLWRLLWILCVQKTFRNSHAGGAPREWLRIRAGRVRRVLVVLGLCMCIRCMKAPREVVGLFKAEVGLRPIVPH